MIRVLSSLSLLIHYLYAEHFKPILISTIGKTFPVDVEEIRIDFSEQSREYKL